jgi:hypothetical protein
VLLLLLLLLVTVLLLLLLLLLAPLPGAQAACGRTRVTALTHLWWHNCWAQVCKGVKSSPQTQQATLWALSGWQCVPLVTAGQHTPQQ